MKKHDNIDFTSKIEMEVSKFFKSKLLDTVLTINPNVHTFVLMDFGLEDDELANLYKIELVIEVNDTELFFSKLMQDMETFNWFNNAPMNQAYDKYVMKTILEMVEENSEEIEEIL